MSIRTCLSKGLTACAAAAIMLTSVSALPVSAETAPTVEYSVGALATPKITKATKTTNSVTLKWSKVKGATGYKVYKLVGKKYRAVGTVRSGKKVKYKVKGLKSGKKYSFKVRAFKKKNGKVTWSKSSKAKAVKTKIDYLKFFAPVIEETESSVSPELVANGGNVHYCFEDLNKDGFKELIIAGDMDYAYYYRIYDYNYGTPTLYWTIHGTLRNDGKNYYVTMQRSDNYSVSKLIYKKAKTTEKSVEQGNSPTYDFPFDKYGNACKTYDASDTSPLK